MFSVIRLESSQEKTDLATIGMLMNKIKEGTFTNLDKVPNRFSCVISESNDYKIHMEEVFNFLDLFHEFIKSLEDFEFFIDIGVNEEDYHKYYTCLLLELSFLKKLVELNVSIGFTLYDIEFDS